MNTHSIKVAKHLFTLFSLLTFSCNRSDCSLYQELELKCRWSEMFFCANIRCIAIHAAPAWFTILSDTDKENIDNAQRTATHTILPNREYEGRLKIFKYL